MTVDDAFNYVVGTLSAKSRSFDHHEYDVYAPSVVRGYLEDEEGFQHQSSQNVDFQNRFETIAPLFYETLWELCRKGVLRPGHAHIQIHGKGTPALAMVMPSRQPVENGSGQLTPNELRVSFQAGSSDCSPRSPRDLFLRSKCAGPKRCIVTVHTYFWPVARCAAQPLNRFCLQLQANKLGPKKP
jgi:hypothetical protein